MHDDKGRPLRLADLARTLGPQNEYYAIALQHGTLEVGLYAPRGADTQSPHTRDEIYVVVHGHGLFRRHQRTAPFGPGDVLFVPAGEAHQFEQYSEDLAVWVMFYGPEGGERPAP